MAYVPSFEHDVFISYAHQDNLDGRVTAFHAALVNALQTNLGNRAYSQPDKWIFFDKRGLDYGDRVTPKLEYAASARAVPSNAASSPSGSPGNKHELAESVASCPINNTFGLTLAEWRQYAGKEVPYQRACPNLPYPSDFKK